MRAVWQTIRSQHRYDRFYFWLGIGVALLPAAAGVLLLGVAGWFITAAAIAGLSGAFLNIFAPSAIIRALAILRTGGRYGERVLTHEATFRFLTELRNRLFSALSSQDQTGRRSGLLLNRLTLDIAALDTVYLRLVVPIVVACILSLGLLLVWWTLSVPVALTGLLFLGVWAFLAWRSWSGTDRKLARRADAASEAMRLRAADLAAGRRDLAIYGGLDEAAQTILSAGERLMEAEDASDLRANRLTCTSALIGQAFLAAMLVVCVWAAIAGTVSASVAVGLVLVVIALPEIFSLVLPGLVRLPRIALAAARTQALQAAGPAHGIRSALADGGPAESLTESARDGSVLRFENVSFRYPGAERNALDALSFEIKAGEILAIAGRSGCGKSTVAALAARLRSPCGGRIRLQGTDLDRIGEADLRRAVTVLSQRPYLFNDTVAANLRIADPDAGDAQLLAALECAALTDRIAESSGGLQTVIGEGGLGLSGGEQRRLALARAFLTQPALFILDEMTEGLDSRTASDVLGRFLEVRRGASVLMIAHKTRELEIADRVLHLPGFSKA